MDHKGAVRRVSLSESQPLSPAPSMVDWTCPSNARTSSCSTQDGARLKAKKGTGSTHGQVSTSVHLPLGDVTNAAHSVVTTPDVQESCGLSSPSSRAPARGQASKAQGHWCPRRALGVSALHTGHTLPDLRLQTAFYFSKTVKTPKCRARTLTAISTRTRALRRSCKPRESTAMSPATLRPQG